MNKHRILSAAVSFFSLSACAPAPTAYDSRIDDDTQISGDVHVPDARPIVVDHPVECRKVQRTGSRLRVTVCGPDTVQDSSWKLGVLNYPNGGGGAEVPEGSRGGN